ncbi:HNH endonuclease [archaeon]|jgi:5-methylcytosine-specific restriction endonuclease McrA|nr:HNH endonuclease [archaeon]MBT4023132.1 HNH endonuclease [archaeon]MBT4271865.1 HNH endonuclease [archaeon]MBT4460753.1 HNH endonuclease [archaeon]MBT4858323.1 HNH endonuclease [archaeon]
MSRYPKISNTPNKFDSLGNKLCRNCENKIAENRRHYCSKKCMNEFNRNNSWFWVRKDVLRRDRYTCQICKNRMRKIFLDVDHIIPINMATHRNPYDKNNLRTLCKECHKAKTKLDREVFSN